MTCEKLSLQNKVCCQITLLLMHSAQQYNQFNDIAGSQYSKLQTLEIC